MLILVSNFIEMENCIFNAHAVDFRAHTKTEDSFARLPFGDL